MMWPSSRKVWLAASVLCGIITTPTFGFDSGEVADDSVLYGYAARHGDIENILTGIPISYYTNETFGEHNARHVYFGNWLRDFSQLIDTGALAHVPEPFLRIIIAVLGMQEFHQMTHEYEVTKDALGVYRPEEHIDNPRGYPNDAQKYDPRLRGPVDKIEYAIDAETGMKNYIANEDLNITTSSSYIREQLKIAIELGRDIDDKEKRYTAMRHLGAGLHTLEDFSAHTNYVELCLLLLSKLDPSSSQLSAVFPYVGDSVFVNTRNGKAPPLVTGTFGSLDAFDSILGEVDDGIAGSGLLGKLGLLDEEMNKTSELSHLVQSGIMKLLPSHLHDQLKNLTNFSPSSNETSKANWNDVISDPDRLWEDIKPLVEMHDDVRRAIEKLHLDHNFLTSAVDKVKDAVDTFFFSALAPFLKPLYEDLRELFEKLRQDLVEKEIKGVKDPEVDIFVAGSKATNPTHTMLSKDHFDSIMNNPAGRIAATITSFATRTVVECWDNDSIDADKAIDGILEALHHPFNASPTSQLQKDMFDCVESWWKNLSSQQQAQMVTLLSKETIQAGKNKLLIEDPSEYNLQKLSAGSTDKPVIG